MKPYVQKALGAALSAAMLLSAPAFAAGNGGTEMDLDVVLEETADMPPVVSDDGSGVQTEAPLAETPNPGPDPAPEATPEETPTEEPIPEAPSAAPADPSPRAEPASAPEADSDPLPPQTQPVYRAAAASVAAVSEAEAEAQAPVSDASAAGVSLLSATGFIDVVSNSWYADIVAYCKALGWMNGVSALRFAPKGNMNRAMMAVVLSRVLGASQQEEETVNPFADMASDAWYYSAVRQAVRAGLIKGYSETEFAPYDPVSREQFATVLWREAGSPASNASLAAFADQDAISDWALDAVTWAVERNLINGKPGNLLDPKSSITRAEAAAILYRFHTIVKSGPPPVIQPPTPIELQANPYDSAKFYTQNGFLRYDDPNVPNYIGLDVSSYQGVIDWNKVAAAGVQFVIIRAGFRGYSYGNIKQDTYFTRNIQGALAAGLDVGAYIFSQATTTEEAVEEAHQLMEWVEGYNITYPLVFDWERITTSGSRTQSTPGATITACARAFCETVEESGYCAMTYSNPADVYSNTMILSQVTGYPFWLAHYTPNRRPTTFKYKYDIWQYSSTGRVDGISGNVDLNLCLTNLKQ